MSKIEEQLAQLKAEVEQLKAKQSGTKKKWRHHCKFCGYDWDGTKEVIKECVQCKRRFSNTYKAMPADNSETCRRFDDYLKRCGTFVKTLKTGKRYLFEWNGVNFAYKKYECDTLVEDKVVSSTYEVMREWDLSGFFEGVDL